MKFSTSDNLARFDENGNSVSSWEKKEMGWFEKAVVKSENWFVRQKTVVKIAVVTMALMLIVAAISALA